MKKLTAVVEFAEHNLGAYLEEVPGIVAIGNNIDEIKKSMEESIAITIETDQEYGLEIPDEFKGEYEIVYKYDLKSFLNAYSKILSKSGLEHLTGINQKQLWHYASGSSRPKRSTVDKVANSIHTFGQELQKIEFA